jgi:hypothetical protein
MKKFTDAISSVEVSRYTSTVTLANGEVWDVEKLADKVTLGLTKPKTLSDLLDWDSRVSERFFPHHSVQEKLAYLGYRCDSWAVTTSGNFIVARKK